MMFGASLDPFQEMNRIYRPRLFGWNQTLLCSNHAPWGSSLPIEHPRRIYQAGTSPLDRPSLLSTSPARLFPGPVSVGGVAPKVRADPDKTNMCKADGVIRSTGFSLL